MENSKIGGEYHQAGVIYVCSGCERDMLDPGNGADLYMNTAPHCHYNFPTCLLPGLYSTLESNLVLLTVPFFPFCFFLFIKLFQQPVNVQFKQASSRSSAELHVDTELMFGGGLFAPANSRKQINVRKESQRTEQQYVSSETLSALNVWNTQVVFDLVLQGTGRKWNHPKMHVAGTKLKILSLNSSAAHICFYIHRWERTCSGWEGCGQRQRQTEREPSYR